MRKWFYIFALVLLACLSCKRMRLYDMELKKVILSLTLDLKIELDIDVDVDVDVEVEKTIKMPEHNKVLFYHPDNGQLLNSEFVGPTGGAISTSAGTYQMVVYSRNSQQRWNCSVHFVNVAIAQDNVVHTFINTLLSLLA